MRWAWVCMVTVSSALAQEAPDGVPAAEAWRDFGKTETVCGQVVDTSHATSVPNAPSFLYLERPRPEQVFTVMIPSAKRDLFGDEPEKSLSGKHICVSGRIEADLTDGARDRKHRAAVSIEEEEQIVVR